MRLGGSIARVQIKGNRVVAEEKIFNFKIPPPTVYQWRRGGESDDVGGGWINFTESGSKLACRNPSLCMLIMCTA